MKFTLILLTDGKNQYDTIIESFTISLETGIRIKVMHFYYIRMCTDQQFIETEIIS